MQAKLQKARGFTLIEMLIVIAVIAILAGIVLTGVSGFQSSARDTRRIADIKKIQNLLELYSIREGAYPAQSGWRVSLEGVGEVPTLPPGTPQIDFNYFTDTQLRYCIRVRMEEENTTSRNDSSGGICPASCDGANADINFCASSE